MVCGSWFPHFGAHFMVLSFILKISGAFTEKFPWLLVSAYVRNNEPIDMHWKNEHPRRQFLDLRYWMLALEAWSLVCATERLLFVWHIPYVTVTSVENLKFTLKKTTDMFKGNWYRENILLPIILLIFPRWDIHWKCQENYWQIVCKSFQIRFRVSIRVIFCGFGLSMISAVYWRRGLTKSWGL